MHWEEVKPIERHEAEAAFATLDELLVCDALVRCSIHDHDWKWVEAQCLNLIRRPNDKIRAVALTCLGHVARIHGTLHMDLVLQVLREVAKDPKMTGRVEDVLDDIQVYLGPMSS